MEAALIAPQFQDADKAREYLEAKRWPDGPVCPHCGVLGEATRLEMKEAPAPKEGKKPRKYATHARKGLLNCRACRKQFSVTVGTIFEDSHIPLNKWLMAFHLVCASKKGISAHQLHRMLGIGYKSAWFMCHRIRYTMTQEPMAGMLKGVVEVDEVYIGGKEKGRPGMPRLDSNKQPVVALLERGGRVRAFPMVRVTKDNIVPILKEHIDQTAHIMTDESPVYKWPTQHFAKHDSVKHRTGEYARKENGLTITTNSVEGFFSIVKRGNYGTFHHWGKPYTQQYLNEFTYRYGTRSLTDTQRAELALKGVEDKRLMLKEPKGK